MPCVTISHNQQTIRSGVTLYAFRGYHHTLIKFQEWISFLSQIQYRVRIIPMYFMTKERFENYKLHHSTNLCNYSLAEHF
jgi:hypothetical protein